MKKKETSILKFLTFAKIDAIDILSDDTHNELQKVGTSDEKLWKELNICRVKLHNLQNILIVQHKLYLTRILANN